MLFMVTKNGKDTGIRETNGVYSRLYWKNRKGFKLVPLDSEAEQFLDGFNWLESKTKTLGHCAQ